MSPDDKWYLYVTFTLLQEAIIWNAFNVWSGSEEGGLCDNQPDSALAADACNAAINGPAVAHAAVENCASGSGNPV